jgi:MOSC domain-containing protein YiiM
MDPVDRVLARAGRGLEGNANQGGRRQVTLIEKEEWERRVASLDPAADPSLRRANLLVSNFPLAHSNGRTLQIGNVRIRIYAETKPCHLMDEALPGLRRALRDEWGGGAFGEVLGDGELRVNDAIVWVESSEVSAATPDPLPSRPRSPSR